MRVEHPEQLFVGLLEVLDLDEVGLDEIGAKQPVGAHQERPLGQSHEGERRRRIERGERAIRT